MLHHTDASLQTDFMLRIQQFVDDGIPINLIIRKHIDCCRSPGQRLAPHGKSDTDSDNSGNIPVSGVGSGSSPDGQQETVPAERRPGSLQRHAGHLQRRHAVGGASQQYRPQPALRPLSQCLEIPNQLMLQTTSTQLTASNSSGFCSTGISRRVTGWRRFETPHWSHPISSLKDETGTMSRNFDSRSASDTVPYPDERNAQPHR